MKYSTGLGAFGTFGNPNDFQQTFYDDYEARFPQTLDLNPNTIELDLNSEIFAVRKALYDGRYFLCFCIYTYARELQSSRKGSFIGSCIVFENCISQGAYIYECLRECHNDLITNPKNMLNNVLQVDHSKQLEVKEPVRFKELKAKPVSKRPSAINDQPLLLVGAENLNEREYNNTVSLFFTKAVESFPADGTLYFTTSPTVIEYVKSKGLISVIPLENFLRTPTTDKESAKQAQQPSKGFSPVPYEGLSEGIRRWESNWVDKLQERIKEHNDVVTQYWALKTKYNTLENEYWRLKTEHNTLANRGSNRSNIQYSNHLPDENWLSSIVNFFRTNKKTVLGVSIVLSVVAALYFGANWYWSPPNDQNKNAGSINRNTSRSGSSTTAPKPLSPIPNDELSGDDLRALNEKIESDMTASQVADLAIRLNPTDIKQPYGTQRDAFAEKLVELNKHCFGEDTKDPKLTCRELRRIPIYKQH